MTTIGPSNDGDAQFYVAVINPTGAVAHDRLARFGLADLARAMNSDNPDKDQRFFATAEERDEFVVEYNKRLREPTLVGYLRRSNCGTSLKVSIHTGAFADCRTYETSDGARYAPLVIHMKHLDAVLSGERAVTTIVQKGVEE